jgi:hypothetical protein
MRSASGREGGQRRLLARHGLGRARRGQRAGLARRRLHGGVLGVALPRREGDQARAGEGSRSGAAGVVEDEVGVAQAQRDLDELEVVEVGRAHDPVSALAVARLIGFERLTDEHPRLRDLPPPALERAVGGRRRRRRRCEQ